VEALGNSPVCPPPLNPALTYRVSCDGRPTTNQESGVFLRQQTKRAYCRDSWCYRINAAQFKASEGKMMWVDIKYKIYWCDSITIILRPSRNSFNSHERRGYSDFGYIRKMAYEFECTTIAKKIRGNGRADKIRRTVTPRSIYIFSSGNEVDLIARQSAVSVSCVSSIGSSQLGFNSPRTTVYIEQFVWFICTYGVIVLVDSKFFGALQYDW